MDGFNGAIGMAMRTSSQVGSSQFIFILFAVNVLQYYFISRQSSVKCLCCYRNDYHTYYVFTYLKNMIILPWFR